VFLISQSSQSSFRISIFEASTLFFIINLIHFLYSDDKKELSELEKVIFRLCFFIFFIKKIEVSNFIDIYTILVRIKTTFERLTH
jgi:hypothetical protein